MNKTTILFDDIGFFAIFVIYNTKKEIVYRKKFQKEISGTDRKVMQAQGVDEICKAIERSLKQEIARNIF